MNAVDAQIKGAAQANLARAKTKATVGAYLSGKGKSPRGGPSMGEDGQWYDAKGNPIANPAVQSTQAAAIFSAPRTAPSVETYFFFGGSGGGAFMLSSR